MELVTVVGARPQFVKAAAVTGAVRRWNTSNPERRIKEIVIHTGQHYDPSLSSAFFAELGLPPPNANLGVGSASHGVQTGEMLKRLDTVLAELEPSGVLVYGDTNSTLAGALAAAKRNVPVTHVEAGLRSGRRAMPEEVNRIVTDHVAQHLFCPSELAVTNLAQEGITQGVKLVGDVMLDVLESHRPKLGTRALDELGLAPRSYALATLHRASNTDATEPLAGIIEGLERLAADGVTVVLALHPRTRAALRGRVPRVRVVDPTSYLRTMELVAAARVVVTDSGGLQKEAYWLGVPCVTVRDETEWPETVTAGWNRLVGSDPGRIVTAALSDPPASARPPVYGDGKAAERIVASLAGGSGEPMVAAARKVALQPRGRS